MQPEAVQTSVAISHRPPEIPNNAPLAISPAAISRHFGVDRITRERIGDPEILKAEAAVDAARTIAERLLVEAKAIWADGTMTTAARALAVRKSALRSGERIAHQLDGVRERVSATMKQVEAATGSPNSPRGPTESQVAGEVRSRLSTMTAATRTEVLDRALVEGDMTILGAVLTAPGMLAGLGVHQVASLRLRYREKTSPDAAARLRRLDAVLGDVSRAGVAALAFIKGLADTPESRKAELTLAARMEASEGGPLA